MSFASKAECFDLRGLSIWRGLDIGSPCATPRESVRVEKPDRASEHVLFDMAESLGLYIQAYAGEKNGAMVHNLIPIQGKEKSLSNEGSDEFPFHVEAPHREDRPDYLALLCLRGHPEAKTRWASVSRALSLVSFSTYKLLTEKLFVLQVGESWGKENAGYRVVRVLEFDDSVCLNLGRMHGLTPEAHEALRSFSSALDEVSDSVCLQTGDLMLLNNRTCVHARTPFPVQYDGSQRWLQRVYLRKPL